MLCPYLTIPLEFHFPKKLDYIPYLELIKNLGLVCTDGGQFKVLGVRILLKILILIRFSDRILLKWQRDSNSLKTTRLPARVSFWYHTGRRDVQKARFYIIPNS